MKVYNQKLFNQGIFFLAVGVVNLIIGIKANDQWYDYWLCALLFGYALDKLHHAFSQKRSKDYVTEEHDERNQAINSKSRDQAFVALRWLTFSFGLLLLVIGTLEQNDSLHMIGFYSLLMYSLTFLLEFICFCYYNDQM